MGAVASGLGASAATDGAEEAGAADAPAAGITGEAVGTPAGGAFCATGAGRSPRIQSTKATRSASARRIADR